MKSKAALLISMLLKGCIGFFTIALPLFLCAGSLLYVNAWVLIGALFVLMLVMGLILLFKFPQVLEKRLDTREKRTAQERSVAVIGLSFLVSFAVAGLDFRFGWSDMSVWVGAASLAVMLLGYVMYCAVLFQNAYASRTVRVQEGQRVISTGLYAVVRHPMYLSTLLVFISMPFILNSYAAVIPMLAFPPALVSRIKDEEAMLMDGLEGYREYMTKTRYRLIPFIW